MRKQISKKASENKAMEANEHWPMNQVEVQIVRLEILQRLRKTLGDIGLVGVPPAKT